MDKKWCLEVEKMKAEIALRSRHAAPVAQWTSVLDLLINFAPVRVRSFCICCINRKTTVYNAFVTLENLRVENCF